MKRAGVLLAAIVATSCAPETGGAHPAPTQSDVVTVRSQLLTQQDVWTAGVKLGAGTKIIKRIEFTYKPSDQASVGPGRFYNEAAMIQTSLSGDEWLSAGIETWSTNTSRSHAAYVWGAAGQVYVPECHIFDTGSYSGSLTLTAVNNDPNQVTQADLLLIGTRPPNPVQFCSLQYVLPGSPRRFAPSQAYWDMFRDVSGGAVPQFTTYVIKNASVAFFDGTTKAPDPADQVNVRLVNMMSFDMSHVLVTSSLLTAGQPRRAWSASQ